MMKFLLRRSKPLWEKKFNFIFIYIKNPVLCKPCQIADISRRTNSRNFLFPLQKNMVCSSGEHNSFFLSIIDSLARLLTEKNKKPTTETNLMTSRLPSTILCDLESPFVHVNRFARH